jgi:peptide/nickel transport system permease protein
MASYAFQRLLLMIPTFIGITLIGFLIMRLAPGDPAELRAAGGLAGAAGAGISLDKQASIDVALAQWREQYGLDRPLHIQYVIWLKSLVTLDFGESFKDNQPVWSKIADRVPITINLNILSLLVVYLVAIPLGVYSATRRNTLGDQITTVGAFILFAVPTVWAATMALVFICGGDFLYLFPPGGLSSIDYDPSWPWWRKFRDQAWHLFLPRRRYEACHAQLADSDCDHVSVAPSGSHRRQRYHRDNFLHPGNGSARLRICASQRLSDCDGAL